MRNATRRSLLVMLLVLGLVSVPAVRALGGSTFEAADGDLASAGGVDWDAIVGQLDVGYDEPTGQTDDSLGGKEDDPVPSVEFGSIPNNKSDLLRFYVYHESVPEGETERDFLYLAWIRANTLGTANMDFEFNQAEQISSNDRTPVRTEGDILVTFAFTGNNNLVQLGLSVWTETGPCEASSSAPCWGPLMPLSGIAEGAVNGSNVVDPVTGATLAAGTFGEAAIDLTEAGVFDRDECVSFGSAYVKSRSSDSFSSTMKDLIRPIDVKVTNCATVTVRKNAVPDDAQDFTFTPSADLASGNVVLDDDPTSAVPASHSFMGRYADPQTIAEQPVAGWDLTGLTCIGQGTPERDASGALTGRVTVNASTAGAVVDCTWVNTKRGRLLVDEVTIPGGSPQTFGFSYSGGPDNLSGQFALAASDTPWDSGTVRPGTYSVVQQDDGPEWDLASVVCSDGSPANAVVIDPGETVMCTFTNVKRGTIAVDVVTTPLGDPQTFPFTLSGGPDAVSQSFALADATAPHASTNLRAGTYATTAGAVPAGWDLASSSCTDGSAPSAISLSAGESVTCTFVFVKRATIRVDVVTTPSADPQTFSFGLSGGPDSISQSFNLADATPPYSSGFVRAGTYAATAGAVPAGWDLASSSCTDGSATSAISLSAGESVTCTFVFVKRGTIRVDVVTTPSGEPQTFSFGLSGGPDSISQSFSLADATPPYSSGWVRAGSYAVTAGAPGAMFDLASSSCTDGSAASAISLSAGESVTCTFVYVKRARVVVSKIVTNTPPDGVTWDPSQIPFGFTTGWGASFTLHHGESQVSSWIPSLRGCSINESAANGWITTSECVHADGTRVNGGSSISVTPQAGEQVACTFYNELQIHPGSSGFWRNWSNHYTTPDFRAILDAALDESPIFATLFDPLTGALRPDAVSLIDGIYDATGTLSHLMREVTSTFLNLGVSLDPTITNYQNNHDICLECVLDLDEIPGAEELLRSLAPCELPDVLRIADLVAVAEAAWTGNLSTNTWSFDGLTDSQLGILDNVFGGINQGNAVVADVTKYPELTCVAVPGPVTYTWYRDADGDGHGVLSPRTQTCDGQAPDGYAGSRDDCDDTRILVWPGAPEVCDGRANDCTAPGYPAPVNETEDGDGDGASECSGDCNDADPSIYTGAIELCDGRATDCLGGSWPLAPAWDRDDDGDSLSECAGDCDDVHATVRPGAPQLCDGLNNNCSVPGWPAVPASEADADHDGYRACNDCNDAAAAVHPGGAELCNGVDDDCTGVADDGPAGLDPDQDGRASACDNCPLQWNSRQDDLDRDGHGDTCDNCPQARNADQANADSDSRGDVCDTCPAIADVPTEDLDRDSIGDACDNCLNEPNAAQSDLDTDGEGDACDWNDGAIYLRFTSQTMMVWDAEPGQQSWTCVRGDLGVLKTTGNTNQAPGSNPLAAVDSGILHPWAIDATPIPAGQCAFYLINGD
jgi:Putative metal-binding motif/Prealbumin-like fold domain